MDHKTDMESLARQSREQFNRFIGCIGIVTLIAAAVVLIIGYWATH